MRNIVIGIGVLVLAIIGMRAFGLTFGDLKQLARQEIKGAASDSKALMSGEYADRMSQKMREEAASTAPPAAPRSGYDSELNRELAADRKRMLEQRADALQKQGGQLLRGNSETLRGTTEKAARQSGGTQ